MGWTDEMKFNLKFLSIVFFHNHILFYFIIFFLYYFIYCNRLFYSHLAFPAPDEN